MTFVHQDENKEYDHKAERDRPTEVAYAPCMATPLLLYIVTQTCEVWR